MTDDQTHMESCWCPECLGPSVAEITADRDRWAAIAERLYNIMLAHETVSHDEWNQGIHDCWLVLVGDTTNG